MNAESTQTHPRDQYSEFVGLFPAAGHARRLRKTIALGDELGDALGNTVGDTLQGSKEIEPVIDLENRRTIAVGDYLVREYQRAGIRDIIVIRRAEKQDIKTHFLELSQPGTLFSDLNFIDVLTTPTPSTAHTIDKARELFKTRPVALGFPDIIINSPGVFGRLCSALQSHNSDICLGLFPATNPQQSDMVACSGPQVERIDIKPARTRLTMTWSCATWQPSFNDFMHHYIARYEQPEELYLGRIFQAAASSGMKLTALEFPAALSLDIGTPETLAKARSLQSY